MAQTSRKNGKASRPDSQKYLKLLEKILPQRKRCRYLNQWKNWVYNYFDRNMVTTCNFCPCTPCHRIRCTGRSWSWALPQGMLECCKFCIFVFHRCRIYHRELVLDDRISFLRSRRLHRSFASIRSNSPIHPNLHRFLRDDPLWARTLDFDTTESIAGFMKISRSTAEKTQSLNNLHWIN